MNNITPNIFRKYDIRGQALGPNAVIDGDVAYHIGRAYGTYLQRSENLQQVVIGHDNRITSEMLHGRAITGLVESGCDVLDIGLVSTPLVYWTTVQHGTIAGLMITGSHLAPDKNGFKLSIGAQSLYGDKVQGLYEIISTEDYVSGTGSLERKATEAVYSDYVSDLANRAPAQRALKVVIDAGNGTGGLFSTQLVAAWGHTVLECLYCEPDGRFPNHQPDPGDPENVHDLSAKVRELGADIGLAFDGDADRLGVVDEQGNLIAPDRVLTLLAKDVLSRNPGAQILADVSSSQVVLDEVSQAGGSPLLCPTGHSLVKAKMAETGALLGGEMSGHIFMAEDYFGFDDAYLVAGRVLALLAAADVPLSALDQAMPRLYSTPLYRPHCPPELNQQVMDAISKRLKDRGEALEIDGLRMQFENGWGLVRPSNTEPVLSMRFEGRTAADAQAYKEMFFAVLGEFPQLNLSDIE